MNNPIFKTFFLSLCIIANTAFAYAQTASILPPGYTQYLDNNGKPLTSGKVYNYVPSTTTAKTTWQDSSQSVANTNPVILNAGGRAKIFGDGSYRQIVKDRYDNIIWDANTSSTGTGGGSTTATGDGDLVGTIKPWAGMTAPNQYAFTYGQEVSRTTYDTLYTAITSSQSIFCTSGSPILTGLSDTTNFWIGMAVEVSCLAAGNSTIVSKTATTITLSANANVTTNVTATMFPWGRGNGSTTFNLPDFRGVPIAGNNNMGGVASSNLNTTYFGATDPNSAGALGGSQSVILAAGNLPAHTHTSSTLTDPGHFHGLNQDATSFSGSGTNALAPQVATGSTDATTTGITISANTGTNSSGLSTAFSIVQPTRTSNYIIKITPDTNSATASGVTSLGGMTGDIACGSTLTCTGNTISVNTGGFLLAANNLSDVGNANTSIYNLFNGQTVGYTPEMAGAVQNGSTNVTRYFASAATTISGLTGRRHLALQSGAGYLVTPLQFGGSNPTSGTAVGEIGPASTTVQITGNPTTPITIGQSVTGAGVTAGTIVTAFGAKTNGGVGTYIVNTAQTVAAGTTLTFTAPSVTASISGTTMTVTAVANGQLNLVDSLVGTGIIPGTTITAQTSGSTGLAGTYTVSYSQTVAATTVRAYPYTVVAIPNGIVGAPGGQTATVLKGFGSNATPNSVIKIVNPPALGTVLGFELGNFRVDGNSLYGSPLSFHGFSTTSSGGIPWAHDIDVLNGTRDTCGVYVLGDAPAGISWGAVEATMSNISSTSNAVCGFRFDGDSGTSNWNIQSIQLNSLKANGNGTGNGFEFDYANVVCIACLAQSNGGVGFAWDNVNYGQFIHAYTEGNAGGASTGTANTKNLDITGQLEEGVNATLQACGTCNIKYNASGGAYRNDGNVKPLVAVATSPTAGQGILGSSAGAGLQLFGRGATYDVALYNWGGTIACGVLTGTQQLDCNAFSIGTKTLSVGGNWAMSGAFTFTGTLTNNTAVTFPTSGTLATTSAANIPLTALATQATNTIVGNATAGSASPTALAIGSCSTASSALQWTTNTGFGCNTSITATTNANLTGPITSVGNATSIASQTGTGTQFVMSAGTPVVANLTITSTATFGTDGSTAFFGPGGTGATNATLVMSGSSGSNVGARFAFNKNGVTKWLIGDVASITGSGTSASFGFANSSTGVTTLILSTTDDSATFAGNVAATSSSTGTVKITNGLSATGAIWAGTYINVTPTVVNSLPACAAGTQGARSLVTNNATAVAFNGAVTTGGANITPVFCDGTNWKQG